MKVQQQGGYTVIEVTLFLAISGMLFLITLLGTGVTIRSVRFSDSARSLHAYVQQQYSTVLSGVNTRTDSKVCAGSTVTQPGAGNCLVIGKMLRFAPNSDTVKTYIVTTTVKSGASGHPGVPDLSDPVVGSYSDEELVRRFDPAVVPAADLVDTYEIPWGARITASQRTNQDGSKTQANTYVMIRSPRSSRMISYTFNMSDAEFNNLSTADPTNSFTKYITAASGSTQRPTNYCLRSLENIQNPLDVASKPAVLRVGLGQGQSDIAVDFDVEESVECTTT